MKRPVYYAVIFACVPAAVIVLAVLRREPAYEGRPALAWLQEMRMQQESSALEALRKMGKKAVPTLQMALKSPETAYRLKAAWVLGQLGPAAQEAVPDLLDALDDDAIAVRIFSVQSLMAIGASGDKVARRLVGKLSDPSLGVSNSAADLLNRIEQERRAGNGPAWTNEFDYAMAFLNSSSQRVRSMGVSKLAGCPREDGKVMRALKSLSNDPDEGVRNKAVDYLENRGSKGGSHFGEGLNRPGKASRTGARAPGPRVSDHAEPAGGPPAPLCGDPNSHVS